MVVSKPFDRRHYYHSGKGINKCHLKIMSTLDICPFFPFRFLLHVSNVNLVRRKQRFGNNIRSLVLEMYIALKHHIQKLPLFCGDMHFSLFYHWISASTKQVYILLNRDIVRGMLFIYIRLPVWWYWVARGISWRCKQFTSPENMYVAQERSFCRVHAGL